MTKDKNNPGKLNLRDNIALMIRRAQRRVFM
jgi:hypothetical protein